LLTVNNLTRSKANYENLRFDINTSDAGVNSVRPYTIYIPASRLEQYENLTGWSLLSANGVTININAPVDADTGFTYQQSSGDSASGGRMGFRVSGIKKSFTVVRPEDLTITNAPTATAGQVLTANGDGTFTFV